MSFSSFFSQQARQPKGLFGRYIMSAIFNRGNADLNAFVFERMSVQPDDRILEIGFGTGKLSYMMAQKIDGGFITGVDFSDTMVSVAQKRNRKNIHRRKMDLFSGDFDDMAFERESFTKVCSVNTLYFWKNPVHTVMKVAYVLKPNGKIVLAFEDGEHLKQRNLSRDIFRFYTEDTVKDLLRNAGFSNDICVESRRRGNSLRHCVVAVKT